ncbi:hypothetical protein AT00_20015 [Pseudoalteromonas lipolytica SCSIO 04301]|nr:hypothetical protein AT00_20015 [Pseudoalteromonas lipolytica SCSIO 04301]
MKFMCIGVIEELNSNNVIIADILALIVKLDFLVIAISRTIVKNIKIAVFKEKITPKVLLVTINNLSKTKKITPLTRSNMLLKKILNLMFFIWYLFFIFINFK